MNPSHINPANHSAGIFWLRRARSRQMLARLLLQGIRKILFVLGIYVLAGLLMQQVEARTNSADANEDKTSEAAGGSLLLCRQQSCLPALSMRSDVDIRISGPLARATVKQHFINSSANWMEGIYSFPLPENAAVDHFRLRIGQRLIEGEVKEKQQARRIYRRAKNAGKRAGLIEQQRSNVFTTAVANIAPGETVVVEIEYQQVLDYRDGEYRLRFPMTLARRYTPDPLSAPQAAMAKPAILPAVLQAGLQPAATANPGAFEQERIDTAVDNSRMSNPTRLRIELDAGVSLAYLRSSFHRIDVQQRSESRYSIRSRGEAHSNDLAAMPAGALRSDRDFELVWKPQLLDSPQLATFSEQLNGQHYTLLTLLPPAPDYVQQTLRARDVLFVLDISGSMSGTSITQAKAALLNALQRLRSIDRFNIIWFNDHSASAFGNFVSANTGNIHYARRFISKLQAGGGTDMKLALNKALTPLRPYSRFRQVIFLTDGQVSNEAELFALIERQLGETRLFTVGIGSAPNSYFMRKAALKGRGSFTYIGDVHQVKSRMDELLNKLENPALTNIQLDIDRQRYQVFPNLIPDLYAGDTASILIRGDQPPASIQVQGDFAGSEWQQQRHLPQATAGSAQSGIRVAWARAKIESLMGLYHEAGWQAGRAQYDSIRQSLKDAVIDTAIEHHLVSRFTSLVAVDKTPVNIDGLLQQQRLGNNRPHGQTVAAEKTLSPPAASMLAMIQLPQTATASRWHLLLGLLLLTMASLCAWRYRRQFAGGGV